MQTYGKRVFRKVCERLDSEALEYFTAFMLAAYKYSRNEDFKQRYNSREECLYRLLIQFLNKPPVYHIPIRLHITLTHVLIMEVIGMLPYVDV